MRDRGRLSAFQAEILEAFFRRSTGFFLTGGGALAAFHLRHRETHDLDLFTVTEGLESGVRALIDAARDVRGSYEEIQSSPDFRRFLLSRGPESVLVDLVRDRTEQVRSEKAIVDGIAVDPAEEIFGNKLCALLGRAEIRDLVDVQALERAGHSLEEGLRTGAKKEGGLTPGQLAWVLSQIVVGADAKIPGDASPGDLESYRRELIDRLAAIARPRRS